MNMDVFGAAFWGDANVLKIDCGDGYTVRSKC